LKGVPFKSRFEMEESRTALAAISNARKLKQTSTSQFCISFQVKFITYGGKESLATVSELLATSRCAKLGSAPKKSRDIFIPLPTPAPPLLWREHSGSDG
jgi:hypothetical protein